MDMYKSCRLWCAEQYTYVPGIFVFSVPPEVKGGLSEGSSLGSQSGLGDGGARILVGGAGRGVVLGIYEPLRAGAGERRYMMKRRDRKKI